MKPLERLWIFALVIAAIFCAGSAFAMDLAQARDAGWLGEQQDGYVAAVAGSAEASALAGEVNTRRKAEYERIAKEKGQTPDVVARLAAGQIISQLKPGNLYQAADGSWKKR